MTHFLHYAPQSHFEQGIFAPYASLEEAERQASWEIAHGADPDLLVGVFEAEYAVAPKFGWVAGDERLALPERQSPHLDPENRSRVHTKAQLVKRAKALIPVMYEEHVRAVEDYNLDVARQLRSGLGDFKASVPGNAYTWCTGGTATAGACALTAATAKTVILVVAASANQPSLVEFHISFDGVTASAVPVLVELISGTAGGAGTPRAALAAMKQLRGWPAQTSQTTAADTYSAEPTTELVTKKWLLTPNGGSQTIQAPLGRETTGIVTAATDAKTWGLRATAPAGVNCHAYVEVEE